MRITIYTHKNIVIHAIYSSAEFLVNIRNILIYILLYNILVFIVSDTSACWRALPCLLVRS